MSILEKSTKVNSFRCKKDEETGSLRKVQAKKGKAPMDEFNVQALESCGTIRESPDICLVDKKWGLTDGSDIKHDSEANFKHGGCKRRKIVTPIDIGVSLVDDFFDDKESCSTELTNLDEIVFLCFIISRLSSLFFCVDMRQDNACPTLNPSHFSLLLLFFFFRSI